MFTEFIPAYLLSLFAGSAIIIGALLASREHFQPRWLEQEIQHSVTAIGGGALLAAVALVLVPDGMHKQSLWSAIISFLCGGLLAMAVDWYLHKRKTPASQLVAMMLDFVPETIVLGAVIQEAYKQALFLAAIIFIQNLPESFTACKEIMRDSTMKKSRLLLWFFMISISGPLYVFIGAAALAENDHWLGLLMTFCSGGILYLIFNDIAPQVKLKNHWLPPIGALLGFMVGMIGHQLSQ